MLVVYNYLEMSGVDLACRIERIRQRQGELLRLLGQSESDLKYMLQNCQQDMIQFASTIQKQIQFSINNQQSTSTRREQLHKQKQQIKKRNMLKQIICQSTDNFNQTHSFIELRAGREKQIDLYEQERGVGEVGELVYAGVGVNPEQDGDVCINWVCGDKLSLQVKIKKYDKSLLQNQPHSQSLIFKAEFSPQQLKFKCNKESSSKWLLQKLLTNLNFHKSSVRMTEQWLQLFKQINHS